MMIYSWLRRLRHFERDMVRFVEHFNAGQNPHISICDANQRRMERYHLKQKPEEKTKKNRA